MNKFIRKIAKKLHWIIAVFLAVYFILPVLSPIFFKLGFDKAGWTIQNIYRFLCHQRPERSFFMFGPKISYSLSELRQNGYNLLLFGYPFVGNEEIGYKMAFCSRDFFMYLATTISAFYVCISPKRIRLSLTIVFILLLPLILDGTIQFISEIIFLTKPEFLGTLDSPYYLSNNLIRAITGTLFGVGTGLFLFSELKAAITLQDYK